MARFRDPELDAAKQARRVFLSLSDAGRQFVIGQVNARQHQQAVSRTVARANGVTGNGVTAGPKKYQQFNESHDAYLMSKGKLKVKAPRKPTKLARKMLGLPPAKRKQDVGSATYRSQFNKNFR